MSETTKRETIKEAKQSNYREKIDQKTTEISTKKLNVP